jgi:hypothetical protein
MKAEADIKIFRPHDPTGSAPVFAADACTSDTDEILPIWKPACPAHREAFEAARAFGVASRI